MRTLVCAWSALQERGKTKTMVSGKPVFVALADGTAYAIADKCPHMGFLLSPGKYADGLITCKEHGIEIDVKTGEVRNVQKADFLKMSEYDRSIKTYKVVVENGNIYIET
jgi:3-phenylpropionate/trans-cinnamate dioxygenase ferredoxin component